VQHLDDPWQVVWRWSTANEDKRKTKYEQFHKSQMQQSSLCSYIISNWSSATCEEKKVHRMICFALKSLCLRTDCTGTKMVRFQWTALWHNYFVREDLSGGIHVIPSLLHHISIRIAGYTAYFDSRWWDDILRKTSFFGKALTLSDFSSHFKHSFGKHFNFSGQNHLEFVCRTNIARCFCVYVFALLPSNGLFLKFSRWQLIV